MEPVDLATVAAELVRRFGARIEAAYVPGKTMFRDVVCETQDVSQLEAEEICDSMERRGLLKFSHSAEAGNVWIVEPPKEM
ncbi:MAG: hypothetical protein ABI551_27735 [Polyangiaceae bacterium]